jgi:hypothetical protein
MPKYRVKFRIISTNTRDYETEVESEDELKAWEAIRRTPHLDLMETSMMIEEWSTNTKLERDDIEVIE